MSPNRQNDTNKNHEAATSRRLRMYSRPHAPGSGHRGRRALVGFSAIAAVAVAGSLTVMSLPGRGQRVTSSVSSGRPVSRATTLVYPSNPTATAAYTVSFEATSSVPAGGDIFLSESSGPTDFASENGVQVSDYTRGWEFNASHITFGTGVTTVPLACVVVR